MSQRRKTAVALGKPLDTPDEELDMLALVTPEDIEAAKADARARMGKRGAALLETAKTPPEDEAAGQG
ncbi:MAG: hypothetical protein WAT23_14540 [Chromatiaceae bacterium]